MCVAMVSLLWVQMAGAAEAAPCPSDGSPLLAAEQILRDTRRGEDMVARVLELLAQPGQIDLEQLPLPLAQLAGDDDRLDVGAIHQGYDGPRHLIERRH